MKYIFIFVIVLLLFSFQFKSHYECKYDHLILNSEQLSVLGELLNHFITISNAYNIQYFAIGGTLIGSLRNGGFMPTDDDIDMGILESDKDKIQFLNSDVFYISEAGFGYKLFKTGSDIFIDIMVFELKDNVYCIMNDMFPTEKIYPDEIFPLQTVTFSGTEINIPHLSKKYLDRVYDKWDSEIHMYCNHHKKKDSDACFYEKLNIPRKIPISYDNSKYLCYFNL